MMMSPDGVGTVSEWADHVKTIKNPKQSITIKTKPYPYSDDTLYQTRTANIVVKVTPKSKLAPDKEPKKGGAEKLREKMGARERTFGFDVNGVVSHVIPGGDDVDESSSESDESSSDDDDGSSDDEESAPDPADESVHGDVAAMASDTTNSARSEVQCTRSRSRHRDVNRNHNVNRSRSRRRKQIAILHNGHQHELHWILRKDCDEVICDLCSKEWTGRSWHCADGCDFDICEECKARDENVIEL